MVPFRAHSIRRRKPSPPLALRLYPSPILHSSAASRASCRRRIYPQRQDCRVSPPSLVASLPHPTLPSLSPPLFRLFLPLSLSPTLCLSAAFRASFRRRIFRLPQDCKASPRFSAVSRRPPRRCPRQPSNPSWVSSPRSSRMHRPALSCLRSHRTSMASLRRRHS